MKGVLDYPVRRARLGGRSVFWGTTGCWSLFDDLSRAKSRTSALICPRAGVPLGAGLFCGVPVHAAFRQFWDMSSPSTGTIPMIKSLVAAALVVGLAGYAVAQETVPGAPAGTAPMTPAPGTHPPIPGMTPAKTGSHQRHLRRKGNTAGHRARASAHHMHQMRTAPAAPAAPKS